MTRNDRRSSGSPRDQMRIRDAAKMGIANIQSEIDHYRDIFGNGGTPKSVKNRLARLSLAMKRAVETKQKNARAS